MEKLEIFTIVKEKTLEVLAGLIDEQAITLDASLRDLSANSIDRAEIIMMILEALQLKIPMLHFAKAKNIDEICDIVKEFIKKG